MCPYCLSQIPSLKFSKHIKEVHHTNIEGSLKEKIKHLLGRGKKAAMALRSKNSASKVSVPSEVEFCAECNYSVPKGSMNMHRKIYCKKRS